MLTSLGRPPRRCCLAGGIMGSTIVHCSSVRSEGYAFRELPSCTIYAHSSPERICANYLPNLFLCQVIFPDSLLETTMKDDSSFRARSRAHGLLLSAAGTSIKAIAKTYQVHRVTVAAWIKHWEQHGAQSLHDKPRSGRPSTLRPEERDIALQYIKEEPHALQRVLKRFADKTDKRLSLSSLKRLAKKARLRWKRVRKSLTSLRDPDAFAKAKR